jgi:hypothetical protein
MSTPLIRRPQLITFSKSGESSIGYISISENLKHIPFEVKRVFWTYFTPDSIVRGRHAHHVSELVIIAAAGRIILHTELLNGETETFVLEKPDIGVHLPPYCWHSMQYSHNAVQLVLANTLFEEQDYIRDFEEFKKLRSA